MTTARDDFVIDKDKPSLLNRIRQFKNSKLNDEDLHTFFGINKKMGWSIRKAWKMLQPISETEIEKFVVPVLYRPFDIRWIFYHDSVVWRTVKKIMRHMMKENLGLIFHKREELQIPYSHFLISDKIIEHGCLSSKTTCYLAPLYLYPETDKQDLFSKHESGKRMVNIQEKIIEALSPSPQAPLPSGEGMGVRAKLPDYILQLCRDFRKHPTETEKILWHCLRDRRLNGLKFRRQHPIGRYIADFYCHEHRLIVEVDGGVHNQKEQKEYDAVRQESLEERGFKILHVTTAEVKNDLEEVLKKIAAFAPFPPVPLPSGEGMRVRAESVFYYIYAVLYSNIYRKKYAEFLKTEFPRVPFTKDYDLFIEMGKLGERLAQIHLMKSSELEETFAKFEGQGNNIVDKVKFVGAVHASSPKGEPPINKRKDKKSIEEKPGRVYINDKQFFSDIPEEIWEYQIGGYQVMEKWLKDRKGRRLSSDDIRHYIKIARALQLTIDLQKQIDELYPQIEKTLINI